VSSSGDDEQAVAARVVARCADAGLTVATAESLTGGLVCAALTSVAGSSAVVRGGVVAYAVDVKASMLGVDGDLLARNGPVHADTAVAMARGAAGRLAADLAVATTGVAGPDAHGDRPAGTVFVAVVAGTAVDGPEVVRELALPGDRAEVRRATVLAALRMLELLLP